MDQSVASSAQERIRSHGFTLADQAISSLSNFLLVVAVARVSDADAFGAFSLAYLAYGLCLALFRAGLGDVLLLRTRLAPESDLGYSGFLAVAFGLGLALAVSLALLAVMLGEPVLGPMLAIAIALPLLLLQDGYRFVLISGRRSQRALNVDAVWLLLQIGLFLGFATQGKMQSGSGLILLWTGAGAVSVALAYFLSGLRPRPSRIRLWLAAGRARIRSLMMDYLIFSGTVYAGLYAVPLISSLATLAALRGAQVFFAPFEVLMNGIRLVTLPALANALNVGRSDFRRRAVQIGAGFLVLALGWGAIVVAMPDSLGEAALGDTWASTKPLLLAFAVGYVALAVSTPVMDGVRGGAGTRTILATRLCAGILQGGGILVGVAVGGAEGGAVGFAGGLWLGFVVWAVAASRLDVLVESSLPQDVPEQVLWDSEAGPN